MRKNSEMFSPDITIDLTPMLDVVFILLIFFIITASFIREHTIPLENSLNKSESQGDQPLQIKINSQNQVFVDGRRVDAGAVRALVMQHRAAHQSGPVSVLAHDDATAQRYVTVANAVRQGNMQQVLLTTYGSER